MRWAFPLREVIQIVRQSYLRGRNLSITVRSLASAIRLAHFLGPCTDCRYVTTYSFSKSSAMEEKWATNAYRVTSMSIWGQYRLRHTVQLLQSLKRRSHRRPLESKTLREHIALSLAMFTVRSVVYCRASCLDIDPEVIRSPSTEVRMAQTSAIVD